MAHTPGPWRFMTDSTGEYLAVFANVQGGTKVICPVKIADEADARLIAAAPDLLAALKECSFRLATLVAASGDFSDVHAKALDAATAALAKAEGREEATHGG